MYNVSDNEVDFILSDITKRGIVTKDVRDNILDHVCCIIEHEMTEGMNFNEFYKNTIAQFYRKELREIEDETNDLLTFKYYYAMKRTLKITGAISGGFILIGAVLKTLHLPGAGIILVLGLAIFSLIFLPLNAVLKFRDDKGKKNRMILSIGMIIMAVACIGILFKIMHWPYALYLIQGSIIAFILFYIPIYFITRFKDADTKFNGSINTIFMIAVCGMLFSLVNIEPNTHTEASLLHIDSFLSKSVEDTREKNTNIYIGLDSLDKGLVKFHIETENLYVKIENIKANLISKSQGINLEDALYYKGQLKTSQTFNFVYINFSSTTDEFSYTSLFNYVNIYNEAIKNIENIPVINVVNIEPYKLNELVLPVLIHSLTQIQQQIISEENAFLNYKNGIKNGN